jgi:hypothetical protein
VLAMDSANPTTSTDTTASADATTSADATPEARKVQFPGLFEPLPNETIRVILEYVDINSSFVLMLVCKVLADFLIRNSWKILYLSGDKKPKEEHVQFVMQSKSIKTQTPLLLSPCFLKMYTDIQIHAVLIASASNAFPECSLGDVSSMVIHLPRITASDIELSATYSQFLDSLPIDKFSSLKDLMLENISITDGFLRRIQNSKVEEMHWDHISISNAQDAWYEGSFASVKRFSSNGDESLNNCSPELFPLVEEVLIHCEFKDTKRLGSLPFSFNFSESKSLQYL